MVNKELSEAAVELNTILKYTSQEIVKKIPKKFLEFMKKKASTTYQFNYDINKPLEKQNIKLKTKELIALIYIEYLSDSQEKREYSNIMSSIIIEIEEDKRKTYDPNNIFKNKRKELT